MGLIGALHASRLNSGLSIAEGFRFHALSWSLVVQQVLKVDPWAGEMFKHCFGKVPGLAVAAQSPIRVEYCKVGAVQAGPACPIQRGGFPFSWPFVEI